ncbi:Bifunctional monothiol glutaredoxin-S16, chloroplastic [Dionaea muscipula]
MAAINLSPPFPKLINFSSCRRNTSCLLYPHQPNHFSPCSSPSSFKLPPLSLNLSYGSGGHTRRKSRARRLLIVSAVKAILEAELVPLAAAASNDANFPPGPCVYAVYDQNNELQFIGISRNVAASIAHHRKSVPDLCVSVKVGVVDEPDRTALTEAWKSWMEAHIAATGKVPPGNEKGNTTWARPPPKAKADLRLTPGRHVELTVPLEQLIDRLVKENKVVAFIKGSRSAPLCGFSQRVIGILETRGVDYESVDVLDEEHNYGLRETLKKYSNWPTFPQVFVNGELVGGCDILTSMHENGELSRLFKS